MDPLALEKSPDQLLSEELATFYADPIGHAYFAYPWGEGPLAGMDGPRPEQEDILGILGEQVAQRGFNGKDPVEPIRMSISSGHGIGKTVLFALIARWIQDTRAFSMGVVTATTVPQLKTKTWAAISFWTGISVTAHWWHVTSSPGNMACVHRAWPDKWRLDAQTCAEQNSEAFAGLHAANSSPYYLVDESSGVPDAIHTVAEGGLTDGEPFFLQAGNMTRARGAFHRSHYGPQKHRWIRKVIDSEKAEGTNKALIQQWREDYGEDSDFFRVRVKGLPPKGGELQLISQQLVDAAKDREDPYVEKWEPLIMGVDVSRSARGSRKDDSPREGARRPARTVIRFRRGRDARSLPKTVIRERAQDTEYVADVVAKLIDAHHPDAVMIDGDGIGGPLCDMLRRRGYTVVHEIRGGAEPMDRRYYNLRTEMWHSLAKWLDAGCIDAADEDLHVDLVGPESGASNTKEGRELLESKESMQLRGIASPDDGDALAITFAFPVGPRQHLVGGPHGASGSSYQSEYDPTGQEAA